MAISGLAAVLILVSLGRFLPGEPGRFFGMVSAIFSTPFLMEASLFFVCMGALLALNHWRDQREGDEFVYLERAGGPEVEKLPVGKRQIVYRTPPLDPEVPDLLARAEGALEIGDFGSALEAVAEMDEERRESREVVGFRIRLARATGREDLARRLEDQQG